MKLGFIGAGNMGSAILKGYAAKQAEALFYVYDLDSGKTDTLKNIQGVTICPNLKSLIAESEAVILAVKPNAFDGLLPEVATAAEELGKNELIYISIAAGISIDYLKNMLGSRSKVIRVMPNTPALVGAGMSALAAGAGVSDEEFAGVLGIFESIGLAVRVDESMLDTVTGISGSSPAYAYMYMEALISCAHEQGMSVEDATKFAAQSTLGAAKMVLESGIDPVTLRVNVCSPGGTTIEAVHVLEQRQFIETVEEAMDAAIAKSVKMTR